ncbi:hypothetical protein ACGH7X_29620 [Streptomyces sp. BBFR51]|uniref:hypothetical protein n=1 Tax=Streptomyces sp. BBFR51 TaxID=3372856 RepID=UPI0037DDA2F2
MESLDGTRVAVNGKEIDEPYVLRDRLARAIRLSAPETGSGSSQKFLRSPTDEAESPPDLRTCTSGEGFAFSFLEPSDVPELLYHPPDQCRQTRSMIILHERCTSRTLRSQVARV